jgi:hypothetical protein
LKRIVVIKGSFIDTIEEYVLKECLNIMFPGCKIEICSVKSVDSPYEEMYTSSVSAQKG